ncbi:MAG TPA: phytanoyl-CoA dioxygenase family protein [Caulobacteraceae bacterium]|jgi:ectoine hydroxylase-related dioxygenase (phytanoyl-CoA dioxygenase family)|nr:phytanoyl-CoA dioxygenase family protein [Caulobacteraceae bacterium]
MEIGEWSATPDLNDIYRDIRALGLETNLSELEAFGFTVIEGALDPAVTRRARQRIVEIGEARFERRLSLDSETSYADLQFIPFLLFKDEVFRDILLTPGPLALITYLLGRHCILSSVGSHLKGPGGNGLLLHSDTGNNTPDPFTPYAQVANCNFALTDYTEPNGCLAMVPGSHRHQRQPTRWESGLAGERRYEHVVPIEAPAGSAIVWHGNTWHGSFPRQAPGLRVNLSCYFCREYIQPQEDYRHNVPPGYLAGQQDSRLATLLGADLAHGWTDQGPVKFYERRREAAQGVRSWQS